MRRIRVKKLITYEGKEDWVKKTLANSLPAWYKTVYGTITKELISVEEIKDEQLREK